MVRGPAVHHHFKVKVVAGGASTTPQKADSMILAHTGSPRLTRISESFSRITMPSFKIDVMYALAFGEGTHPERPAPGHDLAPVAGAVTSAD